jgi:2-keto-3-deoxy-L-fuconate dehydrogenase
MNQPTLSCKRILVTQADVFMGPDRCKFLAEHGADLIADTQAMHSPHAPGAALAQAGDIDALVINLAVPAPTSLATEASDAEWNDTFAALVHPLHRLVRAASPDMIARRSGKILLMGSGSALRGMKRASTYSAARGAQLAYIQAVGVEVAPHQVQVNAIAQTFDENPTYFPPEVQANPKFQQRLAREVPRGLLVGAREDAAFAAYLCSDAANGFVGQVFPVCGGWVAR